MSFTHISKISHLLINLLPPKVFSFKKSYSRTPHTHKKIRYKTYPYKACPSSVRLSLTTPRQPPLCVILNEETSSRRRTLFPASLVPSIDNQHMVKKDRPLSCFRRQAPLLFPKPCFDHNSKLSPFARGLEHRLKILFVY